MYSPFSSTETSAGGDNDDEDDWVAVCEPAEDELDAVEEPLDVDDVEVVFDEPFDAEAAEELAALDELAVTDALAEELEPDVVAGVHEESPSAPMPRAPSVTSAKMSVKIFCIVLFMFSIIPKAHVALLALFLVWSFKTVQRDRQGCMNMHQVCLCIHEKA